MQMLTLQNIVEKRKTTLNPFSAKGNISNNTDSGESARNEAFIYT